MGSLCTSTLTDKDCSCVRHIRFVPAQTGLFITRISFVYLFICSFTYFKWDGYITLSRMRADMFTD